jgi:hypothetical protein
VELKKLYRRKSDMLATDNLYFFTFCTLTDLCV